MEKPGFRTTLPMLPALVGIEALASNDVRNVTELVTALFVNLTPVIVRLMLCGCEFATTWKLETTLFISVLGALHKSASEVNVRDVPE